MKGASVNRHMCFMIKCEKCVNYAGCAHCKAKCHIIHLGRIKCFYSSGWTLYWQLMAEMKILNKIYI